jgi:RES domain-containing protein
MAEGWRIILASEASTAFAGEGARRYGGRWNSSGVRVVYVSEHQSTAALEVFVNNKPFLPIDKFKAFYLQWPDGITEVVPHKTLPGNWRVHPPAMETRQIGDRWVQERRSAVLAVPSAVSPADTNFLINPLHPDFKRIRIAPPIDFEFDSRLLNR